MADTIGTRDLHAELLASIRANLASLEALAQKLERYTDAHAVYRMYHQSFKVYVIQPSTIGVVAALTALSPRDDKALDPWFLEIIAAGTGHEFTLKHNKEWMKRAWPIVAAYQHARYVLDETIRSASFEEAPQLLPEGWAAVLSVFQIR